MATGAAGQDGGSAAERRRHERFKVNWRAVLMIDRGGTRFNLEARASQVSMGDLSVRCDNVLSDGLALDVVIVLPKVRPEEAQTFVQMRCTVVRGMFSAGAFEAGLRIDDYMAGGDDLLRSRLRVYQVKGDGVIDLKPAVPATAAAPKE
jgi:hypothetical protein